MKKTRARFLSVLLTLCMLLTLLPTVALAADSVTLNLANGFIAISATGYKQGNGITTQTAETAHTGDYVITGAYTDAGLVYNGGASAVVRIDGLAEGKTITLDGATITPSGASDHALNINSEVNMIITNSVTLGSIITNAPISMTGTGSLTLNDDITSNATAATFSAILSGNISWNTNGTSRAKINHLESTSGSVTVSNAQNLYFAGTNPTVTATGDVSVTNTFSNLLVNTVASSDSLAITAGGTLTLINGGGGVPAVGCSAALTSQKLILSVSGVPVTLNAGAGGTVVYPVEYYTPAGSFTTATYQWKSHVSATDNAGTAIEGATAAAYAPTASGLYSCTVTSGSSVSTAIMTVTKAAPTPVNYGVYVGNTEITSVNAADVLGDGTVSYDLSSKTLTLDGVAISATSSQKYSSGSTYTANIFSPNDLTLVLKGSSTLSGGADYGVRSGGSLTVQNGDTAPAVSTLNINAKLSGLYAGGALEVSSGEITLGPGEYAGVPAGLIQSESSVTLSGGKVTMTETGGYHGVKASDAVTISGGEHTIISDARQAIRADGAIIISNATVNARTLTTYAALSGSSITVNDSIYTNSWQAVKITPTTCAEWTTPLTGVTIQEITYAGSDTIYTPVTKLSLLPAESAYLSAAVTPDDATVNTVSWSSNSKFVTVNEKGTVTAHRPCTAVITATTTATDADGKQLTASVAVTVGMVTDVSLPTDNMTVPAGAGTIVLPVTVTAQEGFGDVSQLSLRTNVSSEDSDIVTPELEGSTGIAGISLGLTIASSVTEEKTVDIPIQAQDANGDWVTKATIKVTVEPVASGVTAQTIVLDATQLATYRDGIQCSADILYLVLLGDGTVPYVSNYGLENERKPLDATVSGTGTLTLTGEDAGCGMAVDLLTVLGHASISAVLPNHNYAVMLEGEETTITPAGGDSYIARTGRINMFSTGTLRFSGSVEAVYNLNEIYGIDYNGTETSLTAYSHDVVASKTLTITNSNVTAGDMPTVSTNDITAVYDGKPVPSSKITGTATYNGVDIPGTWSWVYGQDITNVADSGSKRVQFTPNDSTTYATVTTNATLTITPAAPAVTDVTVTAPASIYAGTDLSTIELSHTDGIAGKLVMTAGQTLTAGTNNYSWTFTPEDGNYGIATGTVSLTVIAGLPYDTTVYSQTDVECINAFLRNNVTVTGTAVKPAMNDPAGWGAKHGDYSFVTWTDTAPKRVWMLSMALYGEGANASISGDLNFSTLTELKYIDNFIYIDNTMHISRATAVTGLNISGLAKFENTSDGSGIFPPPKNVFPNLETVNITGCTALEKLELYKLSLSASQSITGFSGNTYTLSSYMQAQNAKLYLKNNIISLVPVIPEGKVVGSVTIGGKAYTAGEWNDLEANFSANTAITNVTFRDPDTTLASVTVNGVSATVDNVAHTAAVHIPYTAENVTVAATATLNAATVSGTGSQTLATGENAVTLTVHDGAITREYALTVVIERGVTISGWAVGEAAATPVIHTASGETATAATYQYKTAGAADTAYQPYDPEVSGKYPIAIGDYILKATFTGGPDYFTSTTATAAFSVTKASICSESCDIDCVEKNPRKR